MSEKSKGENIEQSNAAIYGWVRSRFPKGLVGEENAVPINIDGNDMQVLVFPDFSEEGTVNICLFLPNHHYARKTLIVDRFGKVEEDISGTTPDFDISLNEPEFKSSN